MVLFRDANKWMSYMQKPTPTHTTKPVQFMGKDLMCVNTHEINRDRAYVVKNLLLAGQVSILCGPPNTGKSAVIAAAASHVSMGRDFAGHKACRAAVLYVAAEDPNGIADRAYPYLAAGVTTASPFHIHPHAINLCSHDDVGYFIQQAVIYQSNSGCDRLLAVFDTLNLCIGEGDENSARDMGQAIGNAQRIARETGAHVMIIHHTAGHDGSRPRGSTAMEGNVDTLLTLHKADETQPEGVVFIAQRKQRSVQKGNPIAFKIEAYDAGFDSEGDALTVPMAVPFAATSSLAPQKKNKVAKPSQFDDRLQDLRRVMGDLDAAKPGEWFDAATIRRHTGAPFNAVRDNQESLSRTVRKILDALQKNGAVERSKEGLFRVSSRQVVGKCTKAASKVA